MTDPANAPRNPKPSATPAAAGPSSATTGPALPLIVAITGGVASGKSALTAAFADLGVPIADADVAAREVVAPGSDGLARIVDQFGAEVLDQQGSLDRARMRERIFADPQARQALEAIVHPLVRTWLRAAVEHWQAPYGVLAIPLLVESGDAYAWVDRVLVVDVPEATQLARLRQRDGIEAPLAQAMLAAQAGRDQRLAIADDIHDASGPLAEVPARAAALHGHYLALAQAKQAGRLPPPRLRIGG